MHDLFHFLPKPCMKHWKVQQFFLGGGRGITDGARWFQREWFKFGLIPVFLIYQWNQIPNKGFIIIAKVDTDASMLAVLESTRILALWSTERHNWHFLAHFILHFHYNAQRRAKNLMRWWLFRRCSSRVQRQTLSPSFGSTWMDVYYLFGEMRL